MNNPQNLKNPSSSSLKSRFTTRFLRALTKINAQKPISSSSPSRQIIFQRYRRIKVAADKSMAYSVRSKRTWSREMLWKLRSRSCHRLAFSGRKSSSVKTTASTSSRRAAIMKKTSNEKENKTTTTGVVEDKVGFVMQADELRELVPGGEAMDVCNLLDETAHYIKCLTTQVQVMRKIVDFYSL